MVEDDADIVENLSALLSAEGFTVKSAGTQQQAVDLLSGERFDLALLDISLPDGSGYAVCSVIKADTEDNLNRDVPVVFITAYDDEASAVASLDMGADDYISKPFRPRELVLRLKNILRRTGNASAVYKIGDLTVDAAKGVVHKGDRELFLSVLEYRLLLVFLNHKDQILSREKLIEEIWDIAGEYVNDNTLTVYIKRLRGKIENDPQHPEIIRTVRGKGYKISG